MAGIASLKLILNSWHPVVGPIFVSPTNAALEYEMQSLDVYQSLYGCDDNRYLSRLSDIISLSYYLDLWDSFNYYLKLYNKYISEISINLSFKSLNIRIEFITIPLINSDSKSSATSSTL